MAGASLIASPTLQVAQSGTGFASGSSLPILKSFRANYNTGTLLDQCDLIHAKQYSLAAATQSLDLFGGTLLDLLGNAAVFARVNLIATRLYTTTDGQALTFGAAGSNEWSGTAALLSASGTIRILASTSSNEGFAIVGAPNTTGYVVDATHKILKIDPGAATFLADIIIIGRSV